MADGHSNEESKCDDVRAVLIVSFALDDNLFDSSHVIRDLTFEVLTRDEYWRFVRQTWGDVSKENFGSAMRRMFSETPLVFHDLSSISGYLADICGFKAYGFYKTLVTEYNEVAGRAFDSGVILGSPDFFSFLQQNRENLERNGVDVIYLLVTNKEKSIMETQIAGLIRWNRIPASMFDGMIGWDGKGMTHLYEASANRKPNTSMIFDAINNRRTDESKNKVPLIDPARQPVGFMHIGDRMETDVMLAINMKSEHKNGMLVAAYLTNTMYTASKKGYDKLLDIAETCKKVGVRLYMSSTRSDRRAYDKPWILDDKLREYGADVSAFPADHNFSRFHEPKKYRNGNVVEQYRVAERIHEVGLMLAGEKPDSNPEAGRGRQGGRSNYRV